MVIGEFTKYGLVFASSLTGAVSGYFYTNIPTDLRMKFEKRGVKLLRSSDPLWMYKRIIKQKSQELKELKELELFSESTSTSGTTQTTTSISEPSDEQAIKLLNWCQEKLTNAKWKKEWEKQVVKFCEYFG